MAATEIARVGKNQIRTWLNMLPHHMASYDIIWWHPHHMMAPPIVWLFFAIWCWRHHMMAKKTSYDGKKAIIWWGVPSYDGVCHHMMSYDAMWWYLFLWHQHAQDENHSFSKKNKKMPSTFAAFFLSQASFSEKKWEEPCPRAAVHHGKGNESHEKPQAEGNFERIEAGGKK